MRTLRSVERWEPRAPELELAPDLECAWISPQWLASGHVVAHAGGLDGMGTLRAEVRRLDPRSLRWSTIAALPEPRSLAGVADCGGTSWVLAGGMGADARASTAVDRIDVTSGIVEPLPRLPFATIEPLIAVLPDDVVLVAGGYEDEIGRDAALLPPGSSDWIPIPALPDPRAGAVSLVVGDRFVVFAGGAHRFEDDEPPPTLCFDVQSHAWGELPWAPPRGASLVQVESGVVLVTGGLDRHARPIDACHRVHLDLL